MNVFLVSWNSIVSSNCASPGPPSVSAARTCVCPRKKSPVPWMMGETPPACARKGRISSSARPSTRFPSCIARSCTYSSMRCSKYPSSIWGFTSGNFRIDCVAHSSFISPNASFDIRGNIGRGEFFFCLALLGDDAFLPRLYLLYLFARFCECFVEHGLRDLARVDLYHVDEAVTPRDREVHACLGRQFFTALSVGRVDDELVAPVFDADTHRRYGPLPGNIRCGEGKRGGVDREDVGVIVFQRDNGDDDLHIALQTFRKERSDGAVHDASGEYRLDGGAAFAAHGPAP